MIRRLRLATGLVMLSYVTMHLLNHALGLVSLQTMERALGLIYPIWSQYPTQTLLYGAFLVHYALALWALWQRRTLRLRGSELAQLVLGFAIPILLARHVVANRVGDTFFHTDSGYYSFVLWALFVRQPSMGVLQLITLVVAWSHAMIGLYFWLRVRPWFERMRALGLVIAVLVPVLAILGVVEAARHVMALAAEPGWTAQAFARMRLATPETLGALERVTQSLM